MAVHGALAAFYPWEEDWFEYLKDLPFTLQPMEILPMKLNDLKLLEAVADLEVIWNTHNKIYLFNVHNLANWCRIFKKG